MGSLFVVSAPSGAGKTTLNRRLRDVIPDLSYSVSFTTRPPRPGELNERDYFFISRPEFQGMIDRRAFLEWAEVYGQFYGTGRAWVEERLARGLDVLVDIDTQGARQIKANFPKAVLIFITPPSFAELRRRLRHRQTETETQMQTRLKRARDEIEARSMYDYLIVNDDLEQAVKDMVVVIRAERLRLDRAEAFWSRFFTGPELM